MLYTIAQHKLEYPDEEQGQTLVVCPPILFDTWQNEVEKHFKKGILTVARYGSTEDRDSIVLCETGRVPKHVDIILTSYTRIFMDLRQHLNVRLGGDEKTLGERLLGDRHYRLADRAMLLGTEHFFEGKIDEELITVSEPLARTGLFSIKWLRVVLDEAHKACNPGTKTFAAAMCLAADKRWWVTGTPDYDPDL